MRIKLSQDKLVESSQAQAANTLRQQTGDASSNTFIPQKFVIIGSNCLAYTAFLTLVQAGFAGDIVIVEAEPSKCQNKFTDYGFQIKLFGQNDGVALSADAARKGAIKHAI